MLVIIIMTQRFWLKIMFQSSTWDASISCTYINKQPYPIQLSVDRTNFCFGILEGRMGINVHKIVPFVPLNNNFVHKMFDRIFDGTNGNTRQIGTNVSKYTRVISLVFVSNLILEKNKTLIIKSIIVITSDKVSSFIN